MTIVVAIDPGISKCGIIKADLDQRIILEAIVIQSNLLKEYLMKILQDEDNPQVLIGNGTSCGKHINIINEFVSNLVITEEKNSTFKAKQRYFEIFPLKGIKSFLPRELFIVNKNLDAFAALIIMEEYYDCKFKLGKEINPKTWRK